jgi:aspartate/methionine/tyrosine aminotransferase
MNPFQPFVMERWQSTWENRVAHNLSESGVEPVTTGALCEMAGIDIAGVPLGYGQSNGTDGLRARIAALYDGAVGEDGIVVTNGSAEANFVVLWDLVRAGDEVVVLTPTYMQTYGLAAMTGARVREVPLRDALRWQPDPAEIHAAVNDRTRLIVVTNPGNPTGVRLDPEVCDAIVRAAERTGAWILADEVYHGAEIDGRPTPSFLGRTRNVVSTGSLSKAYGLPGLRLGWAATTRELAERLWARTDYTTISPGELTDFLASHALREDVRPRLLERTRAIINEGLGELEAWMGELGCFQWHRPDAGAICYARCDLPVGSAELAEQLRVQESVLVVPGDHFGMDDYIRFGTGLRRARMRDALARFRRVAESHGATPAVR